MRFIGSKALLLNNIAQMIAENTRGRERVFCDIFSGTGAVARYFKPKYRTISNDLLYFSYAVQKATIENNTVPRFETLKKSGIPDPFAFLEETKPGCVDLDDSRYFITRNYSPNENCRRMYLSPKNAGRIDFIRSTIECWRQSGFLSENEYYYLLAGLIEGVPFVSNITGTYGAYLKKWDKRACKDFKMMRLEVTDNGCQNACFHQDANRLISDVEGDILYIDPPYNSRQYVPNYHLLETIARYDCPEISGVTGMRPYENQKSAYCVKGEVLDAFADLISKARFSHIVVSYSTDGLMSSEQIEAVLKKCGVAASFRRSDIPYRKYKSKVAAPGGRLHEQLYYVRKRGGRRSAGGAAVQKT